MADDAAHEPHRILIDSHPQLEASRRAPQASGVGWRTKRMLVTPKKPARHAR
jgi:hypothetical protein